MNPDKHLLKHPFYQAWSAGQLPLAALRTYARQYYHHVEAFPRYVSATHSNCERVENRQTLLENLIDEERGADHHPELWLRFAEALGDDRETVKKEPLLPQTRSLIDTFVSLSRSSYAEGLGALHAYESQVPTVAASKIEGLQTHYGIHSDRALEFFRVHLKADIYHAEAAARLLSELSPEERSLAEAASNRAADALWTFLDGAYASCH